MSDLGKTERVQAALVLPGDSSPARLAPSIRRTSHIDMLLHAPDGPSRPGLSMAGAARDLVTLESGTSMLADATVSTTLDGDSTLRQIDLGGRDGEALLGASVAAGFRDAVARAFPDEVAAATPLALLLDDLPVAALISGYAMLYLGLVPAERANVSMKSDICSGWREGGTMMSSVRAERGVPVTIGPAAPPVAHDVDADPFGWHRLEPLQVGAMRRRRLLDIRDDGPTWAISAMFRDSHHDAGGSETILHEYALTATVDAATQTFLTCDAVPRVLPWVECPVAAASADGLVGRRVDEVRALVRAEFRGTRTCTHLNDLLRSLGDVGSLVDTLRSNRTDRP
jgi:hypothetical protein